MKVSSKYKGRLYWLALNNINQVYFLSEREADAVEFKKEAEAIRALDSRDFFAIPKTKFSLESDSGTYPITNFMKPFSSCSMQVPDQKSVQVECKRSDLKPYQQKMLDEMTSANNVLHTGGIGAVKCKGLKLKTETEMEATKAALKPHQTTILERMTSANNVLHTGGIGAGSKGKRKKHENLICIDLDDQEKDKAEQVQVFIDEASKVVFGKGKGSQRTNEEAVEQVAAYYGLKPEEVHQAVQDHIKGKPDLPEAGVPVQVADIDEAFCLLMSEKIKAFLLDPAIKGIVSIMPVEKAAGLPTSTISNYLFGKRERIPLHHIGPVVKVLQAIGFKA